MAVLKRWERREGRCGDERRWLVNFWYWKSYHISKILHEK